MSWGYKILIVYFLFIAGIGFMVYESSTQKIDLVTTDYYAKELKYQQKIDQIARVEELSEPVSCNIINNDLVIEFPKEFNDKRIAGEIRLYCPSDEQKDVTKQFDLVGNKLTFPLPKNVFGQYELHLLWKCNGEDFFIQKKLFL